MTGDKFERVSIAAVPRSPTLSARVTDAVEKLIADSELVPGDRMPSERVLAEKFDVSRTVIREAVRALVAKGLLDVRRGSGTVVCGPQTDFVSRSMSLLLLTGGTSHSYDHVHEVRVLLEVHIASLAAERRNEIDIMHLDRALDRMVRDHDRESFASADVAFHSALAAAAQNPLLLVLHDSIADVMIAVRQQAFDPSGSVLNAQGHHRKIFEAVRDGDPVRAAKAMEEHLLDSRRLMEGHAMPAPLTGEEELAKARGSKRDENSGEQAHIEAAS